MGYAEDYKENHSKVKGFTATFCLTLLAWLCTACVYEPDEAFTASDDIVLEMGGTRVFVYDEGLCQLAWDSAANEFRAHTDNMSDYFILTLSELPGSEGQRVSGRLFWATALTGGHKNDITFKVVRLEGDVIWLWDARDRIGVSIRVF